MQIQNDSLTDKVSLLTIAIPTYNRASDLDLCLRRIKEDIDCLSGQMRSLVKIYVSDNASTDNTEQVISQFHLLQAGEVEFVRNQENIGGERNVVQCYESATTPYVWILGDDDVILPGGLQKVLDVLVKQEVDVLYVKGYGYSGSYLDEPIIGRWTKGVVEYSTALDFVKRTHVMLTFITGLIVRSGVKDDSVGQLVNGSHLPQLGWVLPLVRDGKKFVIIKDRIFAAKTVSAGGYGPAKVFANNLMNISNSIFQSQPRIANAIQNGALMKWFPNHIMRTRTGQASYLKEDLASGLDQAFRHNWRYYFFIVPLLSLPVFFARLYFFLIVGIRKLFGPFLK